MTRPEGDDPEPEYCDECGWRVDSYTHQNKCAVGIVASEDAVEKVRELLAQALDRKE